MKPISEFKHPLKIILTDIDDTLTLDGRLLPEAFSSLWRLAEAGISVVPVTGRPAGWCELIARQWPVAGIVGENGAFYFTYRNKKMQRSFSIPEKQMAEHQKTLATIRDQILKEVPGAALASDQFCRINDLAIDFCEDVPALDKAAIQRIVAVFHQHGATAKVSSIHVNGWFGNFDKLTCSKRFLQEQFSFSESDMLKHCAFVGDSPNDEPMWSFFPYGFGVANVKHFINQMKHPPQYVANSEGGIGFKEITDRILACHSLT